LTGWLLTGLQLDYMAASMIGPRQQPNNNNNSDGFFFKVRDAAGEI
jgi:hypothetical protein